MRTLPQTRCSPVSRSRVMATAAAGLSLLWLTGATTPPEPAGFVEPVAASPQRDSKGANPCSGKHPGALGAHCVIDAWLRQI